MPFEASLNQTQKQVQRLAMNQQMQQSLKVLRYGIEDLHSFLNQKQLDNPFIQIKENGLFKTSTDDQQFVLDNLADHHQQTLKDYLLSQVKLTMRRTYIRGWVIFLIDQLDQNGYLKADLDLICNKTKVDQTTLLDALTLLQQLDPPGVGARNLQECILLQIQADQSAPKLAYQVIDQHFDEFVEHDWSSIMNQLKIKNQEIAQIISYIKTLSPAPGSVFGTEEIGYIYPDLIFKVNNLKKKVEVTLTKKTNPEIIFKQSYFEKFVNLPDQEVKDFLQQKRSEYKTLINNLEQRGTTILKVGKEIANFQKDFFLGENHTLKPLLLRDVAQKLQLHESTISRAVNGKYLKCDFGVFELKSFFKRPISSKANADLSAESIQVQIKALIKAEDPQHPLSDSKLVKVLADSKIFLSRRTVAKYREELHIPSSTKRKQKE